MSNNINTNGETNTNSAVRSHVTDEVLQYIHKVAIKLIKTVDMNEFTLLQEEVEDVMNEYDVRLVLDTDFDRKPTDIVIVHFLKQNKIYIFSEEGYRPASNEEIVKYLRMYVRWLTRDE